LLITFDKFERTGCKKHTLRDALNVCTLLNKSRHHPLRCVLVLSTEFCRLEENHNTRRHCFFFYFPYAQEYVKDQNTRGNKEIYGKWKRGNFLVFSKGHLPRLPCKGVHTRPQLPLYEVNGINDEKFNRFSYDLLVCHHIVSSWRKYWPLKATFSIKN